MVNWKIFNMERNASDGIVFLVHWKASISNNLNTVESCGSVELQKPESDIILYENLTEDVVLNWIKNRIDVASIETSLISDLDSIREPTIAYGLPWSTTL